MRTLTASVLQNAPLMDTLTLKILNVNCVFYALPAQVLSKKIASNAMLHAISAVEKVFKNVVFAQGTVI